MFPGHGAALLTRHGVALLVGHGVAHLSGHWVTFLPRHLPISHACNFQVHTIYSDRLLLSIVIVRTYTEWVTCLFNKTVKKDPTAKLLLDKLPYISRQQLQFVRNYKPSVHMCLFDGKE